MMKVIKLLIPIVALAVLLNSCSKKEQKEIDTEYPVINNTAQNAFPRQCSVIKRGEKFVFRALLSDNVQLGSVSVDVHNDFDHHTHSTEVSNCELDPGKAPVKPFLLIQSYPIPSGSKTFEIQQEITVPADVDPGDYHFLIRLTDQAGWQTIKGISVKIQ